MFEIFDLIQSIILDLAADLFIEHRRTTAIVCICFAILFTLLILGWQFLRQT